ncbi:cytochrome C [Pseudodesulfovibrio sp. JC047]|uniref:cytochrome c3 family protein n=1 Tax=Pseudodesulfovibrio sp. JC047 TaxID=2683199 RepID=UPI0013D04326|nr:NapC/NirT family cytochrome c [Pseudodesulfovibrio sp. JC047]NDV18455.1 cytochrome C [Pseudodesulfovibrio sp. JC047]
MKKGLPGGVRTIVLSVSCVLAIAVVSAVAFEQTSTTGFCVSCHEMKQHKAELQFSSHVVDKDKKPIECRQCHMPAKFGPRYVALKAYLGVKDVVVHTFGDPEDFYRRELQMSARRFVPDDSCRACHEDLKKNVKGEALSREGLLAHDAYLGINGQTGKGCADCHQNVAHLPVFDRRYEKNAEFAARLAAQEEGM